MSQYIAQIQQALTRNRDLLMAKLKTLNLTEVRVDYSGGGDSGDVTDIEVIPETALSLLKSETLICHHVHPRLVDGNYVYQLIESEQTLEDALTTFTMYWLTIEQSGWEIYDGTEGTMTVDITGDQFDLDHTEFFQESKGYAYQM